MKYITKIKLENFDFCNNSATIPVGNIYVPTSSDITSVCLLKGETKNT